MFKLQNLVSAILIVLSGTKNDIRDKKRYQGDISFLCPPIINLIKAQVCDKYIYIYGFAVKIFWIQCIRLITLDNAR